jgi:hypothetical protein
MPSAEVSPIQFSCSSCAPFPRWKCPTYRQNDRFLCRTAFQERISLASSERRTPGDGGKVADRVVCRRHVGRVARGELCSQQVPGTAG